MKLRYRPLKHKLLFLFFYFSLVSILVTMGFTGSYLSDLEVSSINSFQASIDEEDYYDCPPIQPIHPQPDTNAQQLPTTVTLSVYVFDVNNDSINVSFYNANDHSLIDTVYHAESGTRVSATWNDLDQNTTYSWYTIAEDWEGQRQSQTWTFTTNSKPIITKGPIPADHSDDISQSPVLNITVYDYNNDVIEVTFYSNQTNQALATYTVNSNNSVTHHLSDLGFETVFSWYATLNDSISQTQTPVWKFTTVSPPPTGGDGGGGGNSPSEGSSDENQDNENDDTSSSNHNNTELTAIINAPEQAYVNTSILFNATQNTTNHTIISYNWSLDQTINITTIIPYINLSFNSTGNHTVQLTITDVNNSTATTNHTIRIKNNESIDNESEPVLTIEAVSTTPNIQQMNHTIHITATLTNTTNTTMVTCTITNPDNITNTQNLTRKENTSLWYLNNSYHQLGEYTYNISAIDETLNQIIITDDYNFYIGDTLPPIIRDYSAPQGTTGDVYQFNISITDFDLITNASVLINDSTLLSLTNSYDNIWQATMVVPHTLQPVNYTILAEDLLHQNETTTKTITIIDNDTPTISNITINQNSTTPPATINISCNVTDNIALAQVNISITDPSNTTTTSVMTKDNSLYYYNTAGLQTGNYSVIISAKDPSNNTIQSSTYQFILT